MFYDTKDWLFLVHSSSGNGLWLVPLTEVSRLPPNVPWVCPSATDISVQPRSYGEYGSLFLVDHLLATAPGDYGYGASGYTLWAIEAPVLHCSECGETFPDFITVGICPHCGYANDID